MLLTSKQTIFIVLLLGLQLISTASADCTVGDLYSHEDDCGKFYLCIRDPSDSTNSYLVEKNCPDGMGFNGVYCQNNYQCEVE